VCSLAFPSKLQVTITEGRSLVNQVLVGICPTGASRNTSLSRQCTFAGLTVGDCRVAAPGDISGTHMAAIRMWLAKDLGVVRREGPKPGKTVVRVLERFTGASLPRPFPGLEPHRILLPTPVPGHP